MPIYDTGARVAKVGANVASTLSNLETNRDQVQADNAQHKLRKNTADAANNPDSIQASIDAIDAQNQKLSAAQAKQATYSAFDLYAADRDPRHLNLLMKDEPSVRAAFGGAASIQRIDPALDAGLLNKYGIPLEKFNPNQHLKFIMPDGSERVQDMGALAIGTGWARYKDNQQLDDLIKESQLWGKGKDGDKTFAPGDMQKNAEYLAGQGVEGGDEPTIANNLYLDRTTGNTAGQMRAADEAITGLFEAFGSDEEYFNADMSKRGNRLKAGRYIRRLEAFGKVKLSAPDRADLKDLNTLVATAGVVDDKLTPEVTGAFDTLFRDVKKYISAEVDTDDQLAASSAYAAFRNTTRHALFGATLTQGEIDSFNQAFGTLRQKYPAVMTQFKTALIQTRSKLQSIYELNDPVLTHYYMGKTAEDVSVMIRSIDERLELFGETGSVTSPSTTDDTGGATTERRSMESILGPATVQPQE